MYVCMYVYRENVHKYGIWVHACVCVGCVYIYICHRHGNWVKKKTERFRCIYSIQGSGVDAGRCADKHSVSSVHVQWFSCWKIKADDHDVMK